MSEEAVMELEPVQKLTRDLTKAAATLSLLEVRYLSDQYGIVQKNRLATENQVRALNKSGEPHEVLLWLGKQCQTLENQIKKALDQWTEGQVLGRWAKKVPGIGPVLAAGLMAHIDLEHDRTWYDIVSEGPEGPEQEAQIVASFRSEKLRKAAGNDYHPLEKDHKIVLKERTERIRITTAGKTLSFAGWIPGLEWKKGEVRPWNAQLKVILWKCGESFVKVSGRDNDIYGKLYLSYKAYIQKKNERGDYAEQARKILVDRKHREDTVAKTFYLKGLLPPAHIHARARRYAVRIFVSHYHHVAYWLQFHEDPPMPYAQAILLHADYFKPPYLDEIKRGLI